MSTHDEAREWMSCAQAMYRKKTGISSLRVGFDRTAGQYYLEITDMAAHVNDWVPPTDWECIPCSYHAKRYRTPELIRNEAIVLQSAVADMVTP